MTKYSILILSYPSFIVRHSIIVYLLLKHHSKQKQFSEMMGEENLHSGTCLIQIGKDIISFTLDRDVANHLNLVHNEYMNWKIAGDQLIISKKEEED